VEPKVERPIYGRAALALALLCLAFALFRAVRLNWVNDDAFITFRYARNLVEGLGLVYNAGERVEGMTNLLWTLWCSVGLKLGVDVIRWAQGWGIVCYGLCVALLAWNHTQLRRSLGVVGIGAPVAAVVAALHLDWSVYATGGLETSAFTLLALLGFLGLALPGAPGMRRSVVAGLALGLATLTRPDAILFGAIGGSYLIATRQLRGLPWLRQAAAFAAALFALVLPVTLWRQGYYGDIYPNSYYAKSAYLSWYSQGWHYLRLFFIKYWILLSALPLGWVALWQGRRRDESIDSATVRGQVILASAFVITYGLYVARVGGDFMFGRLLIPIVPFLAVALDVGLTTLTRHRQPLQWVATAGIAAALLLTPSPIEKLQIVHGIADEREHYTHEFGDRTSRSAATLRRYFDGLDVTVAFTGSQARLMYEARIPQAIECETGLTDRTIARQELRQRGRPGHEKHAPLDYLVRERKTHFAFKEYTMRITGAERRLPRAPIRFDGIEGYILHWDPELLAVLAERGAQFEDFPSWLDGMLAETDRLSRQELQQLYGMSRLFYFEHVDDPERERLLERRLGER